MVTRITIDLPSPLAEKISQLAAQHLRYPKQEILWLLKEAVSASTLPERLTVQEVTHVEAH